MTFVAGEIACTLEDRNAQRTHTHRRDCRPRLATYSAGRLVVHVRDDTGSEFSARSWADPQSKLCGQWWEIWSSVGKLRC